MYKRIFTLIIAMLVLLGCANAAFAAKSQSIEFDTKLVNSVGISFPGEGAVTRGEFIVSVIRLMNIAQGSTAEQIFEDVPADGELGYSVYMAQKMGLISSGNTFSPDNPVTLAQMSKIAVIMLGYEADAVRKGGYPYGYVNMAAMLELTKNIDVSKEEIDENDFYRFFANCLKAKARQAVSVSKKHGDIMVYYSDEQTFMDLYYNCSEIEGIVEANEYSYLYDPDEHMQRGKILINGEIFICSEPLKLGYKVKGYAKKTDGEYEIMAYNYSKTNVLTISADCDIEYKNNTITYFENGQTKKTSLEGDFAVIYNQKAYMGYSQDTFGIDDGRLELVDADNDKKYETVHIHKREYISVSSVSTKGIYDMNNGDSIAIDDKESDITITDDGKKVEPEDISKSTFIEYYASMDRKIVIGTVLGDKVEGEVMQISREDDETEIELGGKIYKTTYYFDKFYNVKAGDRLSFVLSSDEKIVGFTSDKSGGRYACLIKSDYKNRGINRDLYIKVFDDDASINIYKLAESVIVNGSKTDSTETIKSALDKKTDDVIRYTLSGKGEVNRIFFDDGSEETSGIYNPKKDDENMLKRYRFQGDDTSANVYYKSSGYFVPYFGLTGNTKIFCLDLNQKDEKVKYTMAQGINFLVNDSLVAANIIRPYNVNESGIASALLYKSKQAPISIDSDYGVVESVKIALDPDDEYSYRIVVYKNDDYVTYYLRQDSSLITGVLATEDGKLNLGTGDLIRYSADSQNFIGGMKKDYSASENKIIYTGANHNAGINIYSGGLYSVGSTMFTMFNGDSPEDEMLTILFVSSTCVYVTKDGDVLTKPVDEVLIPYVKSESDYSRIVVNSRYAAVRQLIVYEK